MLIHVDYPNRTIVHHKVENSFRIEPNHVENFVRETMVLQVGKIGVEPKMQKLVIFEIIKAIAVDH